MVSLTYTAADGIICGDLAIETIHDIQTHVLETETPSSFRFHMAISLGGAIIILATLLCRDLNTIGLQEHRAQYADSYCSGLNMLRDLTMNLRCAGQVMDDMRDIVNVVNLVLQNGSPGSLDNQDFINVVPANMDDIFPYGVLDSNLNLPPGSLDHLDVRGDRGTSALTGAVPDQDMSMAWGPWDDELLRTAGGPGVPWV